MIRIPKVTMTMRELNRAPACTALVYVDEATSRLMVWRRAATDANQVLIHWADLYRAARFNRRTGRRCQHRPVSDLVAQDSRILDNSYRELLH